MTQQEIIEGNKLIAQFIGAYYCNDDQTAYPDGYWIIDDEEWTNLPYNINDFKFHSSWDWLIPTINKIYESDWYYKWKDTSGQFEKEVFINTKFIETTWEQVVEFIKWYNENKNK